MNDSLIKQLELAIQVEKGEVPWGEIQYRPLSEPPEFVWICVAPCGKPSWNFTNAEYRRKPKPLELWVNIYENGVITAHKTQEDATDCMPVSVCGHCKLYHMKEVL